MKVDVAKVTRSPEMGRMRKVASVGETPTYPNGYVGHTAWGKRRRSAAEDHLSGA